MSKLIIDSVTGTILNIDGCYVVDTVNLDDLDIEQLESGNDGNIADVAISKGSLLVKDTEKVAMNEQLSELMVGIEEYIGEKLQWKEANNEVMLQQKELTLIYDTLNSMFYKLRKIERIVR